MTFPLTPFVASLSRVWMHPPAPPSPQAPSCCRHAACRPPPPPGTVTTHKTACVGVGVDKGLRLAPAVATLGARDEVCTREGINAALFRPCLLLLVFRSCSSCAAPRAFLLALFPLYQEAHGFFLLLFSSSHTHAWRVLPPSSVCSACVCGRSSCSEVRAGLEEAAAAAVLRDGPDSFALGHGVGHVRTCVCAGSTPSAAAS